MGTTLRQIVDDALVALGEVSGAGTQAYSDDKLMRRAVQVFNLLAKRYPWPQYAAWSSHTLDGTLGIVNADAFTNVRDFEDFLAVHVDGKTEPLPTLPLRSNPYALPTGSTPRSWTSLPVTSAYYLTRRLQIYPKAATGSINVLTRVYPVADDASWDWEDPIYLDRDMLSYGTAWMALQLEGVNAGGAAIMQGLMDMRFKDITRALGSQPIAMNTGEPIPTLWTERF